MNKAIELAKRLADLDKDNSCPLCKKSAWGTENHADNCPFAMAYAMLDALDDGSKELLPPETNKMPLRWLEVLSRGVLDEYPSAARPGWGATQHAQHYKLQTLVDGKWHDVEIERNPELIDGEGG